MPTTYWDLRSILDVNPEDGHCVGTAKSAGRRCYNPTNKYGRSAAERLLDQMDRTAQLLDTIRDLETLASLLLCKHYHNSLKRPGYSQVREVCEVWESRVTEEHLRLRERRGRGAERARERTAERVARAERSGTERLAESVAEISRRVERMVEQVAVAERADTERLATRVAEMDAEISTATDEMTELREEEGLVCPLHDNVFSGANFTLLQMSPAEHSSDKSPVFDIAVNEDPFITQGRSSSRPNLFTTPTPNNNETGHTEVAENEGIVSDISTSAEEELEISDRLASIPPVPQHDLPSPTVDHREAIAEQEKAATNITSESNSLAKFAPVFGTNSEYQAPDFQFETPTKSTGSRGELLSPAGTASSTAASDFTFRTVSSSATTTPEKAVAEESEQISLGKGKGKAVDIVSPHKLALSNYASGSGNGKGKEPESEHPVTPQRPSVPSDSTAPSGLFFQRMLEEDNERNASIVSTQASEIREDEPSTPINELPKNRLHSSTLQSPNEELFGYADITPNSTRYTTYLPARQQHGLLTPPESPEMLMGALNKPISNSGYFRDDRQREDGSPAPRITRKPLSLSPLGVQDSGMPEEQACGACGGRHDLKVAHCGTCEEELEVPSGCLQRFGFRKLKEKVKAVRESFGKRSETVAEFSGSSERTALE